MSEPTATAPAPTATTPPPTKIPPPTLAGSQGSAALVDEIKKPAAAVAEDPYEFDGLEVKGQKQKLKFANKQQLSAILQKALYADQVIKDATQAKKGTEVLMNKIKLAKEGDISGLQEIFSDPEIGVDFKKVAIQVVKQMMEDEKLTPEQREQIKNNSELEQFRADKKAREAAEIEAQKKAKRDALAQKTRLDVIEAMKKYPTIPQTDDTMWAVFKNMSLGYQRFGKHLTPDQAMAVYSEKYWRTATKAFESMTPEQLLAKFGKKTLDKIQQAKLEELKQKSDPGNKTKPVDGEVKKKKHLTEKEFDNHFKQLAGL